MPSRRQKQRLDVVPPLKTLDMVHSRREGKEHHGLCVHGEGRAAAQHLNSGQNLNPQSNQIDGNGEAICSETLPAIFPTYRAAIECSSDVWVVVVGHLLIVGAQEADGFVIAVCGGIVPGYGLVAVISDVLVGRGAQQPEECHLYHSDGVPIRIHVGELWEVEKGKCWAVRGKGMHSGSFKDHQISHPSLSPRARAPCPLLWGWVSPSHPGSCHAAWHRDAPVLLLPGAVYFVLLSVT